MMMSRRLAQLGLESAGRELSHCCVLLCRIRTAPQIILFRIDINHHWAGAGLRHTRDGNTTTHTADALRPSIRNCTSSISLAVPTIRITYTAQHFFPPFYLPYLPLSPQSHFSYHAALRS